MSERSQERRFAVCVRNEGYEASLELHKIFRIVSDPEAQTDGDVRVIDESGEDYLYPSQWFVPIEVPKRFNSPCSKLLNLHHRRLTLRSVTVPPHAVSSVTSNPARTAAHRITPEPAATLPNNMLT